MCGASKLKGKENVPPYFGCRPAGVGVGTVAPAAVAAGAGGRGVPPPGQAVPSARPATARPLPCAKRRREMSARPFEITLPDALDKIPLLSFGVVRGDGCQ